MKVVIDSGIFMNVSSSPKLEGDIYIPLIVYNELKSRKSRLILDSVEFKYTIIETPKREISEIEKICAKIGQNNLSLPDISVLALALYLSKIDGSVIIYTDDYGIRNVAHELNIKSIGIKTLGGSEKRYYLFICKACGSKYQSQPLDCDVCGHNKFKRIRRK